MQDSGVSECGPRTTLVASAGHLVSKKTPVLFCTNRGLYLRTLHTTATAEYSVDFCDVELWNNSRLTSVGLTPDASEISSTKRDSSSGHGSDIRIVSQNNR
ncbi:hypothetical protein DMENIID0001_150800 [Sergentomyia squamirostris]